MNCLSCQHEHDATARFCEECGATLGARTCTNCSADLKAAAKFCPSCGTPTGQTGAAPERDPRAYTPKHLADKILRSKSALEGERKQVTVLFADVKGSTELAAHVDPEDWHQILDRFFQILADGVHRFEGTVNQYTGDGIMALFGAPIAHEDHAQRACYAALELREQLRHYADEVRRAHGLSFSTRMGLNSGEVIVGKIGDDLRMDYTAQGQVVHLAQRMEQLAEPGHIYLTEHTGTRVAGFFRLRDFGPMHAKGFRAPVRVYELEGVGEFRSRFEVARARGLSMFVGREREMAVLEAALERALAGNGLVVGVVADAGTGKSRLTHEFAQRCRARGFDLSMGSCPPHGKSVPLGLIMSEQRDALGIVERDSAAQARDKVATTLARLGPTMAQFIPFMTEFLGLAESPVPSTLADPDARHRELLRYFEARVRLQRDRGMVVAVLEDMHWADDASAALSFELNRIYQRVPSLIVLNFRPEYRPPEATWPSYEEIRLQPLTEESTTALLSNLLGPEASGRGLEPRIHARAAGNPFFVEEIVQSLAESGALTGTQGAYSLAETVEDIDVPDSVLAVLAARIDRLGEQPKQILHAAAVIGKEFPVAMLAAVTERSARDLESVLGHLEHAELVYQHAAYPEVEYAFKHPLTHQVAYESQLREPRRCLHRTVARRLEERHADRLGEKAALIAHHWEEAAEREHAATWHARAAEHIGATSYQESYKHWQRTVELLRDAEDAEDAEHVQALRTRAHHEELRLAFRVGVSEDEAAALYARARASLVAHGDETSVAVLICHYAALCQTAGRLPEYLALMEEGMDIARRAGNSATRAALALDLLWARLMHGALAAAVDAANEALALVGDDARMGADIIGYSPRLVSVGMAAIPLALMGRLAEAEDRIRQTRRQDLDDAAPETLAWLSYGPTTLGVLRGDPEDALRAGQRCFEHSERSGSRFETVAGRSYLGEAQVSAGNWRAAAEMLEHAAALGREQKTGLDILCMASWALPRAYLGLGDIKRARTLADTAVELCRAQRARVALCRTYIVRALIAHAEPHTQDNQARADLDAAEQLVAETGADALLPQIEEARAALATAEAHTRHLRNAHRLYEQIGATGHAARLAKELGR